MFAPAKRTFALFFIFMLHTFLVLGTPAIKHLNPPNGPAAGGNSVIIRGSGFEGATAVNFGIYPAASFAVQSNHEIIATAPAGSIGNRQVSVTTPSGTSPESPKSLYTFQGEWSAYVTNSTSATVNAIDASTKNVTATIGGEIQSPSRIAITPDNKKVYVTSQDNNRVLVLDRQSFAIIASIPVGDFPTGIAINPAGTKAYVTNQISNDVTVIDIATNTVIASIAVGATPVGIAITPNGQKAYVANLTDGSVSVIALATNSVSTIVGIPNAIDLAIHPTASRAFVTQSQNPGSFTEINTTTDVVAGLPHLTGGIGCQGIAINAAGTIAYITNRSSSSVSVVDLTTFIVTNIIPTGGSQPFNLKITPDGSKAYVTLFGPNRVAMIDLAANVVIPPSIQVGIDPIGIAITTDGLQAFIVNNVDNDLSVIDLQTNLVTAKTGGTFFRPFALAINPDSTRAFISDVARLSLIDLTTNSSLAPINFLGANQIFYDAISPDGKTALATNFISPIGTATLIDLTNETIIATIPVGNGPFGAAFSPNNQTAYVANLGDDVTVINVASRTVIAQIPAPSAYVISVTPSGTRAYVTDSISQVHVLDLINNTLLTSIPVGDTPEGIAIAPDGKKAFVANPGFVTGLPSLSIIDTLTNTVLQSIPMIASPQTISITPDGKNAYITTIDFNTNQGNVLVLDLATLLFTASIPVGQGTYGIAITPDPAPVAAFRSAGGLANHSISFDATRSRTAVGSVVSYRWDFGDGQQVTTENPLITHTYTMAGTYPVTLTVVNSAGTSTTQIFTGQTLTRNGGASATLQKNLQILPEIFPPKHLVGIQKINRFASQADIINRITWQAPKGDNQPVLYRIYRDAALKDLLATVPADATLSFTEHNRKKGKVYTYYIVSVDTFGSISVPAKVVVQPE